MKPYRSTIRAAAERAERAERAAPLGEPCPICESRRGCDCTVDRWVEPGDDECGCWSCGLDYLADEARRWDLHDYDYDRYDDYDDYDRYDDCDYDDDDYDERYDERVAAYAYLDANDPEGYESWLLRRPDPFEALREPDEDELPDPTPRVRLRSGEWSRRAWRRIARFRPSPSERSWKSQRRTPWRSAKKDRALSSPCDTIRSHSSVGNEAGE